MKTEFNPNHPPYKPFLVPPAKTIRVDPLIDEYSEVSTCSKIMIPEGTKKIEVSGISEFGGEVTFDIEFFGEEIEKPNPRYKIDFERYSQDLQNYEKCLEEWEKQKKIYDENKARNDELAERVLLEKLKRKYNDV